MGTEELPGSQEGEGHVDSDRQNPPRPAKTAGGDPSSGDEADGFKATPGDDPDASDAQPDN